METKRNPLLVEVTGFEPVAPSLRTKCSAWLSYTPAPGRQFSNSLRLPTGGSATHRPAEHR